MNAFAVIASLARHGESATEDAIMAALTAAVGVLSTECLTALALVIGDEMLDRRDG